MPSPFLLTLSCQIHKDISLSVTLMQLFESKKITRFNSGPNCHQGEIANPHPSQEFYEFRQAKTGWRLHGPWARRVLFIMSQYLAQPLVNN